MIIEERPVPYLPDVFCQSNGAIRFKNLKGKWITTFGHVGNNNYKQIRLTNRRRYSVHRLVARAFCPNEAPHTFNVVHHVNNVKTDNRPSNLQWVNSQLNAVMRKDATLVKLTKNEKYYRICFTFRGQRINPKRLYKEKEDAYKDGFSLRKMLYEKEREKLISEEKEFGEDFLRKQLSAPTGRSGFIGTRICRTL